MINLVPIYLFGCLVIFQHTLLETEVENIRTTVMNALQQMRKFVEDISESARKIGLLHF